jgi:hypothetical protein
MAKGNDGNYLQHSVEVAVAAHLTTQDTKGRLHIALTHGMAPFEACGEVPDGQAKKLLHEALCAAQHAPTDAEPSIVTAYRKTNAALSHYPNTGELLWAIVGGNRLSGGITECDPQKYEQLRDAWSCSGVMPVRSSWRAQVIPGGVLMAPEPLHAPWLYSMDPMTYREEGYADDNNIYHADQGRIGAAITSFVKSGKPGVAALFVYAVKPGVRERFWSFVDDLAKQTNTTHESCWLTHLGGNRNLAALLCSAFILPSNWLPHGLNAGH